jgi:hypothetical protein
LESTHRGRRRPSLRACVCACACGAPLVLAGASAAISVGATGVPTKDTFSGAIVAASGALSGDRGTVTVLLHVGSSATASRRLSLTIRGAACGARKSCVRLSGTPTGSLRARSSIPDTGHRYIVSASGPIAPIGRAAVTGTVTGTGFIRRGREQLRLTLRTAHGTITIDAQSAELPGFSSP